MNSSQDSSSSSSDNATSVNAEDTDLAQALKALEEGVATLRQRYDSVTQAQTAKQEVRVQINRAQGELRRHRTKQLQIELNDLQSKLEEIELTLESQLFAWSSLKEPFWQIVRFGGVGIIIGWLLKSLT